MLIVILYDNDFALIIVCHIINCEKKRKKINVFLAPFIKLIWVQQDFILKHLILDKETSFPIRFHIVSYFHIFFLIKESSKPSTYKKQKRKKIKEGAYFIQKEV